MSVEDPLAHNQGVFVCGFLMGVMGDGALISWQLVTLFCPLVVYPLLVLVLVLGVIVGWGCVMVVF